MTGIFQQAVQVHACRPEPELWTTALTQSRKLKKMTEPFIEMHTESENSLWANSEARGENSFIDDMKYCIYDVAGATHDSKSTMIDYYLDDRDVMLCGIIPNYPGKEVSSKRISL